MGVRCESRPPAAQPTTASTPIGCLQLGNRVVGEAVAAACNLSTCDAEGVCWDTDAQAVSARACLLECAAVLCLLLPVLHTFRHAVNSSPLC